MYKLRKEAIERLSDGATIPLDPANTDYAHFLQWVQAGNTPEPADPDPVPQPPTLAERRAEIDKQRDEKINDGFVWQGNRWHADSAFQTQIVGIISAYQTGIIQSGASVTIRTQVNTNVQMRLDQLIALAGTLMQYVQSVYAWSWIEKDKIT
jgi:hypothetical protein